MNVLHIDEQRRWGGGEQQASYLIRGLACRGHTCIIAGRPGTPFLEADHGVPDLVRIAAPFWGEMDLWSAWRLARAVRDHHIGIIHAHTSHAHTSACLARAMAGRGKVIVSRRVPYLVKNTWINRWKYGLPDHIVCVCERIGEVMEAFGIEASRRTVVQSAIDLTRFDVEPIPRAELGVPGDGPLLGNVASLVSSKDQATLVAAMPAVRGAVPGVHLVIAGEGYLRGAIEAQIRELGLADTVTLLGHRTDVPRILRTLDLFILCSKDEGAAGAILEAMACERPVVATNVGGIPERVQHEDTGLLVPPSDPAALAAAIIRTLREPALAQAMASRGKAQVHARFAAAAMVEGNLRVYERLLA